MILRDVIFFLLLTATYFLCLGPYNAFAQGGEMQTGISKPGDKGVTPPKIPNAGGKGKGKDTLNTTKRPPPNLPPKCSGNDLLIRCDLPECNVFIDNRSQGLTDLNGELQVAVAPGKRHVSVSKNGYETMQSSVNVRCGDPPLASFKLKPKEFEIRLKTNLPNCDILINDPPEFIGKTDENGRFSFSGKSLTIFVQAKKAGYLSDSKSVSSVSPQKEILLNLTPIPAQVRLNANVANAFAQAEGDERRHDIAESFLLEPGRRKLVITSVGYSPVILDLDLQPNQRIEKAINLERLPIVELLNQADQSLKERSYDRALQLCRYVLESEPGNPSASRLMGMVYLERKSYGEAEPYLVKALDGGEMIVLEVRRHSGEKFELTSGHGSVCEGQLRLSNDEIEYRGTAAAENFKVSYREIQIIGLQIKKNVASYLGLKVMNAKGNKKDYNFFSKEKELSQEGKLYLDMIQRLLQQKKDIVPQA